jgi:hypothetical protein
MPNYGNGKIYRVIDTEGYYFIGATTSELRFVLSKHKKNALTDDQNILYKYFNSINWNNVVIECIEEYSCSSKEELNNRELYHINLVSDDLCLNYQEVNDETVDDEPIDDEPVDDHNKKYENGKIYMLTGSDGYYYIGSTSKELSCRFNKHKYDSKIKDIYVYNHFNKLGWDNVKIECIEEYPCKSKDELLKKENEYISKAKKNINCLNTNNSYLSDHDKIQWKKEYREINRDYIREYNKNYIVAHKEAVEEKKKEYREIHKEELKEYFKNYAEKHKEEKKEYKRKYAAENKEIIAKKNKEFRESNKGKISEKGKEYFEANRDILIKKMKKYRENNPDKMKVHEAKYIEKRRMKLNEIGTLQCECGGKYTENHKKRHEESKKHARFLGGHLVETKDGQDSSFPQKEQGQSQGDT